MIIIVGTRIIRIIMDLMIRIILLCRIDMRQITVIIMWLRWNKWLHQVFIVWIGLHHQLGLLLVSFGPKSQINNARNSEIEK
jgi:hypothetical protein